MSKIKVFLTLDGKAVSSLMVPDYRVVRLVVPKARNRPVTSYSNRWMFPCKEHDEPTPTVVLPAFVFNANDPEGTPVGRVRICFLCWTLIEKLP